MNDLFITTVPHHNPNPYRERIFTVNFFSCYIVTTVTSTPSVVRDWLYKVLQIHRYRRHKLIVALGVQWRLNNPEPATLQLCIGCHCLIFQLCHALSVPLSLSRFLNDPGNTFVGVWNYKDESMLYNSERELFVSRIVDLRDVAAERRGLSRRFSMETLAEILLGADEVKKPVEIGNSDWNAYWLSDDQVQYACVDAHVSFLLGKELEAWDWEV